MKNKLTLFMTLTALFTMALGCSQTVETPDWSKAKVIAEKLDHPNAITSDDKNIYFVTGGTVASLNEGTGGVWKMPIGGGQPVQLFKGYKKDEKTAFIPDTFVLATDENYVYFSAGYIFRVLKDGGEPEQITAGTPTEMVLDDENIYWHNYVGEGMKPTPIYSVGKKGGEVKTLTEPANISDIAIDNEFLYWSEPNGIYKISKKGGEKTKVCDSGISKQIRAMTVAKNSIYFVQDDSSLYKLQKEGNGYYLVTQNINSVYKFFIDEENVYFVGNRGSFGTSIRKAQIKLNAENTEVDGGYLASYYIGKDKIYVADISKIYELSK